VHKVVEVEVSWKVTVPVGLAEPAVKAGVTTAVKFTCWLTVGALGRDERVVVVPDLVTT
jgi:hypothetical protein